MTENLNSTRATVAAMMLKTVEDGGQSAAAILSTLDGASPCGISTRQRTG